MPIVALMTCVLVGFVVKTTFVEDEIEKNARFRVKGLYRVMIKFICSICMKNALESGLNKAFQSVSIFCYGMYLLNNQNYCSVQVSLKMASPLVLITSR